MPKVGLSWESPDGTRSIEYETTVNGEQRFAIRTGDHKFMELWDAAMVERMQYVDAANIKSRAESAARDAERNAIEEARKAERENLDGFDAGMTPMQRGKVIAALTKMVLYQGKPISRRDLVRQKIAAGATVVDMELQSPDGTFFDTTAITKTGMQYAAYLLANKP
jgi:hypothetical protein